MPNEEFLRRIDAKLSALLALEVDDRLRSEDGDRRRKRSIDSLLRDAGLSAAEIGRLVGKTERAVNKALQKAGRSSVTETS